MVGHSFGGLVARLYASLYPLNICGMVLVDAAPEYKELAYEKVLPENLLARNIGNRAKTPSRIPMAINVKQVPDC